MVCEFLICKTINIKTSSNLGWLWALRQSWASRWWEKGSSQERLRQRKRLYSVLGLSPIIVLFPDPPSLSSNSSIRSSSSFSTWREIEHIYGCTQVYHCASTETLKKASKGVYISRITCDRACCIKHHTFGAKSTETTMCCQSTLRLSFKWIHPSYLRPG